jgi:predicted nucleic acid-binding protein
VDKEKKKLNIYLDNCCFNRPYDDQTQVRIEIETKAKLFIQGLIVDGKVSLTTSSMLTYENSKNPFAERRWATFDFIAKHSAVSLTTDDATKDRAKNLAAAGLRPKDATHLAFAIAGDCDYFITTDDRILKAAINEIQVISPLDFLKIWEGCEDDD